MSPVVALRTRRSRIVALVALGLFLAFCAFTLRLFVFPDLNAPQRSDVIAVLGGNGAGPRIEGAQLAKEGYAPVIAVSISPYESCVRSIAAIPHVRLRCFIADPQTTQGEGRSIAHLAAEYHWRRIIVVMPTRQATRARLRIGRCYPGQVLEVGVPSPGLWAWVRGIVYEWGALVKALVLQPSC